MAYRRTPMAAGERDRVITIQQRSSADAAGASGLPVETWTTLVAAMPASRYDTAGREGFRDEQVAASQQTRWEINYRIDMDPELLDVPKLRRVIARGRLYDIVRASVIRRREGIELMTTASSRVGPL